MRLHKNPVVYARDAEIGSASMLVVQNLPPSRTLGILNFPVKYEIWGKLGWAVSDLNAPPSVCETDALTN